MDAIKAFLICVAFFAGVIAMAFIFSTERIYHDEDFYDDANEKFRRNVEENNKT